MSTNNTAATIKAHAITMAATNTNPSLTTELSKKEKELFYNCLYRITDGLPTHELESIAKESAECQAALEKEIQILEASLQAPEGSADVSSNDEPPPVVVTPMMHHIIPIIPPEYDYTNLQGPNYLDSTSKIMASDLSPLDRYFTVSALLGRLREPFDTPPPPHSGLARARLAAMAAVEKKKSKSQFTAQYTRKITSMDKYTKILQLRQLNDIYTSHQTDNTAMLALVKRISNHRTATVFRRAVNPLEAPGYTDRILFPVDLTLIKKMVVCGYIKTFEELHQAVGLICHNCVKFNGRDSDYSMLTREFENYVDDSFLDFMQKQKDKVAAMAVTDSVLGGGVGVGVGGDAGVAVGNGQAT